MLKKDLGLLDVFSIAAGAMISSGLFVLPGLAFAQAGPAMIISYVIASVMMIPALLSQSELATAMPKTGGSYFFIERSMGPLMGTIAGLANWLSIAMKATFAMVGIGAIVTLYFPEVGEWTVKLIAAGSCLFFMLLNVVSVKGTGRFQVIMVVLLLIILIMYVSRGFTQLEDTHYIPFLPHGTQSVFAVAGMVFVSFGGLLKVVSISEEVANSKRNVPLGMLAAFVVVTLLYGLVILVTVGVVPGEELSGSLMPITLGGNIMLGKLGGTLITLAAFLAFVTTANAGMLSASRMPMAMSKDGLLPQSLSKMSRRFKTPHISILITCAFMMFLVLALSIENLVKTASTMMILMFVMVNVAVVIMRHSGIQSYRPTFFAPMNPYMQIVTIIIYLFIIFEMGTVPLLTTGGFALLAIVWYLLYIQRKIDRQSALVYMVKNVVSKDMKRSGLEEELKQIALERDEIVPDRFDMLVKHCDILDIEETITAKQFFERASKILSQKIGIDAEGLYKLFLERERDSATIVEPGLAIPHVVVPGENVFDILLVRCKEGIVFSELYEPVKTAFILIGSADERNYHLRALMAIAHIVSNQEFSRRWFQAKNKEQLRDIVLLSSRERSQ